MSIFKIVWLATVALMSMAASAWQHGMSAGMSHEEHLAQMKKEAEMKSRGNIAMGFDQDKATHHFFLTRQGGVIQLETNDAFDAASRDQIRSHLKTLSEEFARGDFRAPLATHSEMPPGVPVMQRLKSRIRYSFEHRQQGAALRISSSDPAAIKAVHDFLWYQITEHATGDGLAVLR